MESERIEIMRQTVNERKKSRGNGKGQMDQREKRAAGAGICGSKRDE